MAVFLRFTLGPHLGVTFGVAHVRSAEVQAFGGLTVIGNFDGNGGAGGDRVGKVQEQLLPCHLTVSDRGGVSADIIDIQIHRIQSQGAEGLGDGREGNGDGAGDGAIFEIGSDVEGEVLDVDEAVPCIFAACFDFPTKGHE